MSSKLLANPKITLGFAGAIVVIALIASFAVSSFVEQERDEPALVETSVPEPEPSEAVRTEQPVTWADSEFSDDWNTDSIDIANGASVAPPKMASELGPQPEFEDYEPEPEQTFAMQEGEGPTYTVPSPVPGAVILNETGF